MDFADYVQLVRRSWVFIVAVALISVIIASAYLVITPKQYSSTATLLITGEDSGSVSDAAAAVQVAEAAASTYAVVIGSAAVMAPAAAAADPSSTLQQLRSEVTVVARADTSIIDVNAVSDDSNEAAEVANVVAATASRVVPSLQSAPGTTSALRLRVIERASPAVVPSSPNIRGILLIGLLIGLVAGVVGAIAREALDKHLRTPEDVRRFTSAPVLALVPRTRRGRQQGVVVRDDPAGAVGEAFRSLRTVVGTLDANARQCFVLTSTGNDQGSAFIAANLAWSTAQSGRSVLLVDMDLRSSQMSDVLPAERSPGLAEVLNKEVPLKSAVQSTPNDRLYMISSGVTQRSPADLLSSPLLEQTLIALENDFDHVIICAPPVLAYADASLIASVAGRTILVASSAQVVGTQLVAAVEALSNVKVSPAGVVLMDSLGADRANRRLRGFRDRA